jgi:hypothetical protein
MGEPLPLIAFTAISGTASCSDFFREKDHPERDKNNVKIFMASGLGKLQ